MFWEVLLFGVLRTIVALVRLVTDWLARRRTSAGARLRHFLAMKKDVAEHFPQILPPKTNGEAIIRELRRMDSYPETDDTLRAISPWFKLELKGTYYRGIEAYLSVEAVLIKDGVARRAPHYDDPQARTVFLVGRIPYEAIEGIDWEGDEFYGFTHIYCRFRGWRGRKGPDESVELYERNDSGREEHLEGTRWKPKRRTIVRRWRDRQALRKAEREAGF